jgi:hypothetical protein
LSRAPEGAENREPGARPSPGPSHDPRSPVAASNYSSGRPGAAKWGKYAAHKRVIAGPVEDQADLWGIFVFQAATLDEAKALAASDPAVKAGRLVAVVYPWWVEKGALPEAGSHCTPPEKK